MKELIERLQKDLDKLREDRDIIDRKASELRKEIEKNNLEVVKGRVVEKGEDLESWAVFYHWVLYVRFDKDRNKNVCQRWRGARQLFDFEYNRIKKAIEENDQIELENIYYDELLGGADVDAPFLDGRININERGEINFRIVAGDYRIGFYRNESNFIIKKMKKSEIDSIEKIEKEEVYLEK